MCNAIGPELRSMIELSAHDTDALDLLLEINDRLLQGIALHAQIAQTLPEEGNPFDDPHIMAQAMQNTPSSSKNNPFEEEEFDIL
jgi:hypothetical protein